MSENVKEKYGIATAVSMVVGIVIGSGIFFKSDDVLALTNGSIWLGALLFLIVGIGVLAGAVVISEYAINKDGEGGIVAYAEEAFGPKFSFIVGWILVTIYLPSSIAVLGRVCADYGLTFIQQVAGTTSEFSIMIDSHRTLFLYLFTLVILGLCLLSNTLAPKLSGNIQIAATITKLIPLFLIGMVGIILVFVFNTNADQMGYINEISTNTETKMGILPALIAIAFAFDGWIVATSISGEMKNAKRNLPIALISGTILIIIIYVLYFIGLTSYLGSENVIAAGDNAVSNAANIMFFNGAGTFISLFLFISVYGGCNGMILAYLRLPHALVKNGVFKDKMSISKLDERTNISWGSTKFILPFLSFFYLVSLGITLLEQNIANLPGGEPQTLIQNLLHGFDVTAIPIVIIYIIYIILYFGVVKYIKAGISKKIYYLPIAVAIAIALLIVYGGILNKGLLYILITAIFLLFSFPFYNKKEA